MKCERHSAKMQDDTEDDVPQAYRVNSDGTGFWYICHTWKIFLMLLVAAAPIAYAAFGGLPSSVKTLEGIVDDHDSRLITIEEEVKKQARTELRAEENSRAIEDIQERTIADGRQLASLASDMKNIRESIVEQKRDTKEILNYLRTRGEKDAK